MKRLLSNGRLQMDSPDSLCKPSVGCKAVKVLQEEMMQDLNSDFWV